MTGVSPLSPVAPSSVFRKPDIKAIFSNFPLPHKIENGNDAGWSLRPPAQDGAREIPCRMGYAPGEYQRAAYSHCMTHFDQVLERAKVGASKADGKALQKATEHLDGTRDTISGSLEPTATALGAVHEALERRCAANPGDEAARACLKDVRDAIVSFGITMGLCKDELDGTRQGSESSKNVIRAEKQAGAVMARCANTLGWHELLKDVAETVLPDLMKQAITDRLPNQVKKFQDVGERANVFKAIQSGIALSVGKSLQIDQQMAGNKSMEHAVLSLLEMPELIKKGDEGQPDVKNDTPVRDNRLPEVPQQYLDKGAAGGPVLINSQPITVNGSPITVDNSSVAKTLEDVYRLMRDDAVELGTLRERTRWQSEIIGQLRTKNEALKEKLINERGRVEMFATGPDLVRVRAANDADNGSDLSLRHASISTVDLESVQTLESRPFRKGVVDDVSQLHQKTETQRNANGDNGLYRSEDQVDGNHRQRMDGTEQRLHRSTGLHDAESTRVDRTSLQSRGGTLEASNPFSELAFYLATKGLAPDGTPPDPYQPDSRRMLLGERKEDTPWPVTKNRMLSAADVKHYVRERRELSGQVFGQRSFSVGSASAASRPHAPDATQFEFANLARDHGNRRGNVKPSELLAQLGDAGKPQQRVQNIAEPVPASAAARGKNLRADVINNVLARHREERSAAFNEAARTLEPGAWLQRDSASIDLDVEDVSGSLPDLTLASRDERSSALREVASSLPSVAWLARESERIELLSDDVQGSLPDLEEIPYAADEMDWADFRSVGFEGLQSTSRRSVSAESDASGLSEIKDVEHAILEGSKRSIGLRREDLQADGSPVRSFAPTRPTAVAQPLSPQPAPPTGRRSVFSLFDPRIASRQGSLDIAQEILKASKHPDARLPEVETPRTERKGSLESFGSQTSYESIEEAGFRPDDMILHKTGLQGTAFFAEDSGSESPEPVELNTDASRRRVADDAPFSGQVKQMTQAVQAQLETVLRQHNNAVSAQKRFAG